MYKLKVIILILITLVFQKNSLAFRILNLDYSYINLIYYYRLGRSVSEVATNYISLVLRLIHSDENKI